MTDGRLPLPPLVLLAPLPFAAADEADAADAEAADAEAADTDDTDDTDATDATDAADAADADDADATDAEDMDATTKSANVVSGIRRRQRGGGAEWILDTHGRLRIWVAVPRTRRAVRHYA